MQEHKHAADKEKQETEKNEQGNESAVMRFLTCRKKKGNGSRHGGTQAGCAAPDPASPQPHHRAVLKNT